ncbi:hypothetical protein EI555_005724, partial [Monodon monoceros]
MKQDSKAMRMEEVSRYKYMNWTAKNPDEDSDNSAIYVQELNDSVTLDDLADFFKQCGVVKVNKRAGQPMIHIYLDKERP